MKATPTMKLFIVFFLVCLTTQIWATTVFAPTRPTASLDSEYMGVQENNAGRAIYRSPKERDETQKPMIPSDDTMLIGVMGPTGSGKTTFINLASGSNLRVGPGLDSCTETVQTSKPFDLNGRRAILVDTPGFDDTSKSDGDVLREITRYLVSSYAAGKKLTGILYFHRISDFKVTGISRRNFEVFSHLCGNSTLGNVVIATTMWDNVNPVVGEQREKQLATDDRFFAPAIGAGATFIRHYNNMESAHSILRQIARNSPLPLRIQQEIVDEHIKFDDAAAVTVLFRDLKEQRREHQREMEETKREMQAANEEEKKRLQHELEEQQARERKIQDEMERLRRDFAAETERIRGETRPYCRGFFGCLGMAIEEIFD